jgi:hypothetical protein
MCLWQWIMFDVNPHFCYWGIHSVKQLDIELIRNWISSIQYQLCHDLEVNRIMHGITMITFFFFFFYWHLPRRDFQPIKMLKNVLRWTSNFERWTSNFERRTSIIEQWTSNFERWMAKSRKQEVESNAWQRLGNQSEHDLWTWSSFLELEVFLF